MMKFRMTKGALRPVSMIAIAIALAATTPVLAQTDATPAADTAKVEAAVNGWGIAINDLTPDPDARLGTLPNGLRYALQRNEGPKGSASVRFAFNVGWRDEEDDENGLAHFIEHMAFNGSTNIPEGELIKKLERLGLAFGADTNASTGMTTTMYKLDLPKADTETIEAALLMMREVASELTIAPAAVDAERTIILSERQMRNDANRQMAADFYKSSLPGTRYGHRIAGGTEDVIKTAPAERLKAFYQGYYRPDNAVLSIVGDFDVASMEAKIKERFAGWQTTGQPRANYSAPVQENSPPTIGNFVEPTAPESIEFYRLTPVKPSENTVASERRSVLDLIGQIALSKRIDKLSRQAGAKIIGGSALNSDESGVFKSFGASVLAKDGNWRASLESAEQELRRAKEFGFTQSEVEDGLAKIDSILANMVAQASARPNNALADELVTSGLKKVLVQSPSQFQTLYNNIKPSLTVDAVSAAFREAWGNGVTAIHIRTKTPIADMQNAVSAALADSTKVAVSAPVAETAKAFAYDSFGKAGKVTTDTTIADLGIRTVRFANGVKLNIRKTAYEAGKIQFGLRVGSGRAGLPSDQPGLAQLLEYMSPIDGLQAHDYDELQKILTGKTVQLGLKAEDDAFVSSGLTSTADLEMQLKLMAATISAFGYRAETDAQWPDVAKLIAEGQKANATALFPLSSQNILSDGDARFGLIDPALLAQRNMTELKAAIDQQLKTGAIELALVGDVDENAAIALVAQSFGALPKRAAKTTLSASQKMRRFPTDRKLRVIPHNGPSDQGFMWLSWPTTDDGDQKASIAREVLAGAFSQELISIVREKLGASYSLQAITHSSSSFKGFGHVTAVAVGTPSAMDNIGALIRDVAKSLATTPLTDDMLLRARKPIAERYQKQDRENAGWLSVVNVAQGEPARLDRRRSRAEILNAITAADVQAMAQQYLLGAPLEARIINQAEADKIQGQ
jgi:zinc protease